MSTNKITKELAPQICIGMYGIDMSTGFKVKVLKLVYSGRTTTFSLGAKPMEDCYELAIIDNIPGHYGDAVITGKIRSYCSVESFKPFPNQKVFELLYGHD